jgi:hypothetical protein
VSAFVLVKHQFPKGWDEDHKIRISAVEIAHEENLCQQWLVEMMVRGERVLVLLRLSGWEVNKQYDNI